MKLYRIKDWDKHFENDRSRTRDKCRFVCVPNKQHGMGFSYLMAEKNGAAIYGIFQMIVGACSQQSLPRNGLLTGNGELTGTPWDAADMAVKFRRPVEEIESALEVLVSSKVGWVEVVEVSDTKDKGDTTQSTHSTVTVKSPSSHPEGKGIEGNRKEGEGEAAVAAAPPKAHFQKPTVKQVELECANIGLPTAEAEKFWSFYESKGWKVGAQAMKSWEHAMVTWRGRFVERGGVLKTPAKAAVTNLDYCKIGNRSWHYTRPPTRDQFQDDSSFEAYSTHFQNWLKERKP